MSDFNRLPKVAALELTYRCNHQCIFCSCPWEANQDYQDDEMPYEEWIQVIESLLQYGVESFTLTGGEPLARPDIKKIIQYISAQHIPLVLISNGRAMDDNFLAFISKYDVTLCISVPGIQSFEAHTGIDNIEHVLGLFEKAKSFGLKTTANIAVTKKNMPELYENVALPLIHGAEYVLLNRFLPGGRGLENTEFLLTIDEMNEMLDVTEEVLARANRYGHVGTELPLCAVKKYGQYKHLQVSSMCAAAKGFFIVDPSGYIKVCNHSPSRICHYTEIDTISKNPYWNAFRNRAYIPEMCNGCDKLPICDGGCREAAHVYYGRITDKDPLFENSVTKKLTEQQR
ncbi:MAG: radical SAM protein [Faecousia sp.]